MIKVEGELSGNGAIKPCLEEGGEAVFVLPATRVMSTNTSDTAENCLPTVGMLYSKLTKEEQRQISEAQGGYK